MDYCYIKHKKCFCYYNRKGQRNQNAANNIITFPTPKDRTHCTEYNAT